MTFLFSFFLIGLAFFHATTLDSFLSQRVSGILVTDKQKNTVYLY